MKPWEEIPEDARFLSGLQKQSNYVDRRRRFQGAMFNGEPELEPISEEDQRKMSNRARETEDAYRAEEKRKQRVRSITNRLREVNVRAMREDRDITPSLDRIEGELVDIERRVGRAA